MDAPTAADLLKHPTVHDEMERAWVESLPDDPKRRHEEGGWIYMNTTTGGISVVRAEPGGTAHIDLATPPLLDDCVVVGKFHTHPNPSADGWEPGPSDSDRRTDDVHGVPDLIRSDNGVHHSGPDRRRGGLRGAPGYPI